MAAATPKYITFDCYGTLTRFRMSEMARELFPDRVAPEKMDAFVEAFRGYRYDEILGDWKPYAEVIEGSVRRTCELFGVEYRPDDARRIYEAVPTWGPHADVPEPLARVAGKIPLVILSNASNDQIQHNVDKLGAPFAHVFTAQQAQAYKPRLQAFEYMFDQLGCSPAEVMHVSSSFRYDQMSAYDLKIGRRVFVNRGSEPALPFYATDQIEDIGGLPGLVGL
ncbi:MAG TPA: haloacid dehalogenase type II [Phenylobacterium sp.]|nr:haloacid dehalogenase type II [Phenylobacterium sp.]